MKKEITKIESLKKRLSIVEKQLDKCRTSTIQDGWQTQRFSKKSRNWDILAQEKMKLLGLIEDEEKEQEFLKQHSEFIMGGLKNENNSPTNTAS